MANPKRKYADRREYIIKAVTKYRRRLKQRAINYKGGACSACGYDKYQGGLEFHHINQDEKKFGISAKGYSRSWKDLQPELDKCILLCSNCHKEVEAGVKHL